MTRFALDRLAHPIVQAPLAGGPSTAALAAAVSAAGGLGFLAAGYKAPEAVAAELGQVRARTSAPVGVNVFAVGGEPAAPAAVERYASALCDESARLGVALGTPRFDDDHFGEKVELLRRARPAVVSFTFAVPADEVVEALRDEGIAVWQTVTTPAEARAAAAAGVDALVVQGAEAGGHRGTFDDAAPAEIGLLALLQLVAVSAPALPLVAAGGIMNGAGVAAALAAGAHAAQLGSAFMLTPEAGTSAPHRAALASPERTALTRAFSGRTARGIVNRFLREHDGEAPRAYPEVHHLTAPLRAAARERGDADAINLWAGQAHELAESVPAGELVGRLAADARAALRTAAARAGA
ncbi:nitronate monooxygenase [Conexibacter stalactiti]|uniref:Propionate 3-nitronate monooxygenase n=1 Tax=Conexibacter stalactiti TaxID=1940611 RepID=A0ABU4I0K9_9ACTN|nr:nitronate monooxygenase [Conexibacter stalactiti]MDW5598899.1 nitronate monooxygenase [Conexibacter stalactiti]MEC5039541.1 nitronate monooxygenase [Conexibacter stalactiti]